MEEFVYDSRMDFDQNFQQWHLMNSDERKYYNDQPYEVEEAKEVFISWMKRKWLEDQKKNEKN
tara:strand:+ start:317 stop:505 length:189 start_codon:yes stop_codon:yes gene_type:complete